MDPLTGRQKTQLRSLGQRLDPSLKIGKGGLTPAGSTEVRRRLQADELVKLRFLGADRTERAALCERIASESKSLCLGAVGHTALFYLPNPDPALRRVLPAINV
jgi:RNA-binding protein